ncbi:OmpH family outer membrane protein [Pseudazoarcus pumilus]|uniref:OmpH family outer membrane protein n=1 Tax=Pseudazoarcus pumilus TaxID=2067960 RepID=UPI0026A3AE79
MKFKAIPVLFLVLLGAMPLAAAAQSKIGFVDSDRLMREAAPAVRAQQRLEKEFEQRDQDLQRIARELQTMQEELERNSLTMGETERREKERAFNDMSRDFQRKQREFREDLNQRRNEELAMVLDRANSAIKDVAEANDYDIILQEAVFASPDIDITDMVIEALANGR